MTCEVEVKIEVEEIGRSITTKNFRVLAGCLSFTNMDKFWKISVVVAVAVVVESQEHRPLVLSGQDGGSNKET